ncbi:MAG: hypothetical protein OHK0039_40600 [Bacteroidia bacterium]
MLLDLHDAISDIGIGVLILAVAGWAAHYRRLPRAFRYLGLYLACNLSVQVVAHQLWLRSMNNLPLLHLNTLLKFVMFSLFFRELYIDMRWFKRWFWYVVGSGVLLLVANSLWRESVFGFNTVAKAAVQLCLMGYVVAYFFDAFGRVDFAQILPQIIGSVCYAILLYYAGSLFIFMFGQWMVRENPGDAFQSVWIVNAIFSTLFQLVAMTAIYRVVWQRRRIRAESGG